MTIRPGESETEYQERLERERQERERSEQDAVSAASGDEDAEDVEQDGEREQQREPASIVVTVSEQQFNLRDIRTGELDDQALYDALPTEPTDYKAIADNVTQMLLEYHDTVELNEEGQGFLRDYFSSMNEASNGLANVTSDLTGAAVQGLAGAIFRMDNPALDTAGDALGVAGNLLDGVFFAPIRTAGAAWGTLGEGVGMVSPLGHPYNREEAERIGRAYAAALYHRANSSGVQNMQFFDSPFNDQPSLFWDHMDSALPAGFSWLVANAERVPFLGPLIAPIVSNVVAGVAAFAGTVASVFTQSENGQALSISDFFPALQQNFREEKQKIESNRSLSIRDIMMRDITDDERDNVAEILNTAGYDQEIVNLLEHGGVFLSNQENGVYRIVDPTGGTIVVRNVTTNGLPNGPALTRSERVRDRWDGVATGALRNGLEDQGDGLQEFAGVAGMTTGHVVYGGLAVGAGVLAVRHGGRAAGRALHGTNVAGRAFYAGLSAGLAREIGLTMNFYGNLPSRLAYAISFGRLGSKNILASTSVQNTISRINTLQAEHAIQLRRQRQALETIERINAVPNQTKQMAQRIARLQNAATAAEREATKLADELVGRAGRNLNILRVINPFGRDPQRWLFNNFGRKINHMGDLDRMLANSPFERIVDPRTGYITVGRRALAHATDATAAIRAVNIPVAAESAAQALSQRSGSLLARMTTGVETLTQLSARVGGLTSIRSGDLGARLSLAVNNALNAQQEARVAMELLANASRAEDAVRIAELARDAARSQAAAAQALRDMSRLNAASLIPAADREAIRLATQHLRETATLTGELTRTADTMARLASSTGTEALDAARGLTRASLETSPELLRVLTPQLASQIPAHAWSGVSEVTIRNLPPIAFRALSVDALEAIPASAWAGIREGQIAEIVGRLSPEELARIFPADRLPHIVPEAVRHLPQALFRNLTVAEARLIPVEVAAEIQRVHGSVLPRKVLREMGRNARASMAEEGMRASDDILHSAEDGLSRARRPIDESLNNREMRRAGVADRTASVGADAAEEGIRVASEVGDDVAEVGVRSLRAGRAGLLGARVLGKALRFIPLVGSAAVLWGLNSDNAHASEGMDRPMDPIERLEYDRLHNVITQEEYVMYRGLQTGQVVAGAGGIVTMVGTEAVQNGGNQINPVYLRRYLDPSMIDTVMDLIGQGESQTQTETQTEQPLVAASVTQDDTIAALNAEASASYQRADMYNERMQAILASYDATPTPRRAVFASGDTGLGAVYLASADGETFETPDLVPDSVNGGVELAPVRINT